MLWNVRVPPGMSLLSSGGNMEPVVALLSETEKLESSLSDLRSLSATYGSAAATQEERSRALTNFNALAQSVNEKAAQPAGRRGGTIRFEGSDSFLKKPNVESQAATVDLKQQSILRELGSLNAANGSASQLQSQRAPQSQSRSQLQIQSRRPSQLQLNGAVSGGYSLDDGQSQRTPTLGLPGMSTSAGTLTLSGENIYAGKVWRDNRSAGQVQSKAEGTSDRLISRSSSPHGELALNDSVSVDLPTGGSVGGVIGGMGSGTRDAAKDGEKAKQLESNKELGADNRLSTARAATGSFSGSLSTSGTPERAVVDRDEFAPNIPAPVPGAPAVSSGLAFQDSAAPAARTVEVADNLHSAGRVSLAVDFPEEGQVYHFKKIKAEARVTLLGARPERFRRVIWLGVLLAGVGLVWLIRRRLRRRGGVARAAV